MRLLLYRLFHVTLSMRAFMAIQLVTGALIALVCLAGQRAGWPRRMLVARALGLATCWMTTFGMATEPSTYILVAPTLAWSLWECWTRPNRCAETHGGRSPGGAISRVILVAAYLLFVMAYVFLWFPWGRIANSYAPEPLAGVLIFGYLLARSGREIRRRSLANAVSSHSRTSPSVLTFPAPPS